MRLLKSKKKAIRDNASQLDAIALINQGDPFVLTLEQRADLTISCDDSAYIPKVRNAGKYKKYNGVDTQIMHNGLLVKKGGYYGDWMQRIIMELEGHHEPQEEKVFYELLKRVKPGGNMIELGSFWSYYSLWFNQAIKDATNICCEPDKNNLEIGKTNAEINNATNLTFINAAAGSDSSKIIDFPLESEPGNVQKIPIMSVDTIVKNSALKRLDLLHMDVQGHEMEAILGATETIKTGKLRFLIVSTHHHSISGDPLTHFKCEDLIKSLGGHIIASHTVLESFSGDGLIAASFKKADKSLEIDISINSTSKSLYRPYEYDLSNLISGYNALLAQQSD